MDPRTTSAPTILPFEFHGRAWEYFRIWIVNVCLSLITLGFYSPWAKVRQKRYFYGSTRLAGASFDYLADPVAILKGRLIAAGLVLVFTLAAQFLPSLQVLFGLAFVIALPWLIIRTRRFNAINTLYRNIRFDFNASYTEAFVNFVALPFIIVPLSLGLAYPWVVRRQKKLLLDHSAYGNCCFSLRASTGDFWIIYLKLGLMLAVAFILFAMTLALSPHSLPVSTAAVASPEKVGAVILGTLVLPGFLLLAAIVYLDVATSNLIWNNAYLGDIRLHCRLRFARMLFLYASNILGIIFSLGLLIPWAKIRMARYRLENLGLFCTMENLEGFAAGQNPAVGAFGEELSDILDVDIGL